MDDPDSDRAETLEEKRARLPEVMRDIPLSDVEAFTSLPELIRKPLAEAYAIEKFDIGHAVAYIKDSNYLFFTPEDILEAARRDFTAPANVDPEEIVAESEPAMVLLQPNQRIVQHTQEDIDNVARLLMSHYADMPKMTAESLAESDLCKDLLLMETAKRLARQSPHAISEFSMQARLYFYDSAVKEEREIVCGKPALKKFLEDKGYPLK